MHLTNLSLPSYLQERGLLERRDIVDGELLIINHSRRNHNFEVRCGAGRRGLFVKQIAAADPQSVAILQREAACYWLAGDEPALGGIREVAPTFRSYDPTANVLVTDLIPSSESLTQYHYRSVTFPQSLGQEIARTLAAVHSRVDLAAARKRLAHLVPGAPPWGLRLHQEPQMLQTYGERGLELFGRLQQNSEALHTLEALRSSWCPTALTHGDIKLDNFLLRVEGTQENIFLIDWELADLGDPLWDVGSVFQAYLSYWVIFFVGQGVEGSSLQDALTRMHPLLRSFWTEYAAAHGIEPAAALTALHRSVVFAGARLIQTAFESAGSQSTSYGDPLLQVGLYLLTRPQAAAQSLLGFEL